MPAVERQPDPRPQGQEDAVPTGRATVSTLELKRLIKEAVEEAIDDRLDAILSPVLHAISIKKKRIF